MIRKTLIVAIFLVSSIFLSGCSLKKIPSAIQINSTPVSSVFIDGKLVGKTPYQANDLNAGNIVVKLIPESVTDPLVSWEGKVKLTGGVLTLVQRELAASDALSSGQILNLEKISDNKSTMLTAIADPDGALISIDGETKGFTPTTIDKIGIGDHQITISKEGFTERTVKAKTVVGYKLIVNVKLSQSGGISAPSTLVTPTISSPTPTVVSKGKTPTVVPTIISGETYVEIKQTPTGWLRVRSSPNTSASEVAKVNPGEKYQLVEEKSGWYKIILNDNTEGWISGQYAVKSK